MATVITWVKNIFYPSEGFCWYSRLTPAELNMQLQQQSASSLQATRKHLFNPPLLQFWVYTDGGRFSIEIKNRAPKSTLYCNGTIISCGDGSLMQGTLEGSQYTSIAAIAIAIMILIAILLGVVSHFLNITHRHDTPGIISAILFTGALYIPRIGLFFSKLDLLDKLKGQFLAREMPPSTLNKARFKKP